MKTLTDYKSRFKILKGGKISLVLSALICGTTLFGASIESIDGAPANAVSSDGTTIVGTSSNHAYYWTSEGGLVDIGSLGGLTANAYDISDDKSTIVGYSYNAATQMLAFMWTEAGGMVSLGDLAGGTTFSSAQAISGDGTTVVGYSSSAASGSYTESFRWTSGTGMVSLGTLAGGSYDGAALGVSYDGSVIVGYAKNASSNREAYRWTSGTGMVGLGFLTGGNYSRAYDVSNDGSVVVGYSGNSGDYYEAIRWEDGTMTGLGVLSGDVESSAYAVSGDGSVVVGYSADDDEVSTAFRWTEATGMQSISEWLAASGYTVSGWSDTTAKGVSDDGTIVTGYGVGPDGYGAFIAKATGGIVSVEDYYTSIESINSVSGQTISNVSTLLHGAHGHPGNRRAIDDKRIMWVAGDISSDNRHSTKDDGYVGEVGVSIKHTPNFTYSVAVGKMRGDSKLDYKGEIDNDGEYLALDADLRLLEDQDLYSTTMITYGENDLTIKRGYDNGETLTHSTGDTKQKFLAFKQRLQYNATSNFFPYVELSHIKVEMDGYSESGGGFPVTYNKSKENITDWRIGLDANFDLDESNRLITTLEGVHRVQAKGNGTSGQISGLGSFNMDGRDYDQNWMRATVGIEHTFEDKARFTLTFNRTTRGEDPQFWSGFNYSMPF